MNQARIVVFVARDEPCETLVSFARELGYPVSTVQVDVWQKGELAEIPGPDIFAVDCQLLEKQKDPVAVRLHRYDWRIPLLCAGDSPVTIESATAHLKNGVFFLPEPLTPAQFTATVQEALASPRSLTRLTECARRLELAAQAARLSFWQCTLSPDGGLGAIEITIDNRWAEILSFFPAEVGKDVRAFWENAIHPKDKVAVKGSFLSLLTGEQSYYTAEYRLRSRSGSWRWVRDHARVVEAGEPGKPVKILGTTADISSLKHALEDLKESQELFTAFADQLPACIFIKDEHSQLRYVNQYMADRFNAHRRLGMRAPDYLPEETAREIVNDDSTALRRGLLVREEWLPDRNGVVNCFQTCKFRIDRKGKAPLLGAISLDITEKKLAEEELRKAKDELEQRVEQRTAQLKAANKQLEAEVMERRSGQEALRKSREEYRQLYEKAKRQEDIYLSLINSTPDAIVLYDLDGRVTYLNQAHTETFGWTLDEAFGRPLPCVPEWDREETDRLIRSIVDEGVPCRLYETKRATKRGALLDVSLSASRYHDHEGRPAGVLVVLRNISESKLARAALLKMSKVFMESIDPIMIRNLEGEVVDINAAAEGMYGWTREELMGKSFKTIVPEFRHARADELQERCLRGEEVRNIEALRCTKSGEVIPVLLSLSLLTDDYGQPLGIAAITKDLTDLKRTEDMLRRRTEALENSNRDLEQFAYIAAHDLREPLIGVAAYLKILQRRHSQKLDHEAQKFVDLALESTTRMDALIQSLLAYSRLGSESPSFERVNANDVVSQAISNLESLIHESRAQLTVDPLPSVVANESQLVQLFQNLISNAVKFAADEPLRIRIGVQPSEDGHCFFVQDNGIGIEAPDFDRVFMIFQRVGGDRERPGTGIGLANCKKIVERHGGRIWVESTPGVGSTFFFTVPFEPGA